MKEKEETMESMIKKEKKPKKKKTKKKKQAPIEENLLGRESLLTTSTTNEYVPHKEEHI